MMGRCYFDLGAAFSLAGSDQRMKPRGFGSFSVILQLLVNFLCTEFPAMIRLSTTGSLLLQMTLPRAMTSDLDNKPHSFRFTSPQLTIVRFRKDPSSSTLPPAKMA